MRKLYRKAKSYGKQLFHNSEAYVSMLVILTCIFTFMQLMVIRAGREGMAAFTVAWILLYMYLIIGVAYVMTATIYIAITPYVPLKSKYMETPPKTAIVYLIRGEAYGLFERMNYTFKNNDMDFMDIWIVSGQAPQKIMDYETAVLARLRERYGYSRVKYLHSDDKDKGKREMMEMWLETQGGQYKYFVPCDADSLLPRNTVIQLMRKAEHPGNKDIAIFQAKIMPANTKTYYSLIQSIGSEGFSDKWGKMEQMIFGRLLSFGHNCLIHCDVFNKVRLPKKVLSHDIWDTVYLEKMGYRTAYCGDVLTYEEIPVNFIEEVRRSARWCHGNLETVSLLFMKDISLATKLLVFVGIHHYVVRLVLLLWVIAGIWISRITFWGDSVIFSLILELVIMAIIFLHRFTCCRTIREVKLTCLQIVFTTFVGLNNIFYSSLTVLAFPFKKRGWIPMKKNPYESTNIAFLIRNLWPSTVFGLLAVWIGVNYANYWGLLSSPLIISFVFGIPFVYITSRGILEKNTDKIPLAGQGIEMQANAIHGN